MEVFHIGIRKEVFTGISGKGGKWRRWVSENIMRVFQNGIALVTGNSTVIRDSLSSLLISSVSYFDTARENFYHGLILGIVSVLSEYKVKSNRESGKGCLDIMLIPGNRNLPGIVIEVKAHKGTCSEGELGNLANQAIEQAVSLEYSEELRDCGCRDIIVFGMAFSGKNVEVVSSFV